MATAKCGANEHVVSGGFNTTPNPNDSYGDVVSRAVDGDSWTIRLYPNPGVTGVTLTTFAYCAHTGGVSKHEHEVAALREKANTTATARCASGETLVSGEYAFVPSSGQSTTTSFRDYAASASKWTAMAVFLTRPAKLAAFAYCERGVVVKVRSSSSASIPHESDGSATARCHKGETLLSGGYTTTPTPDWHDTAGPDLFYSGSFRSGVRSWTAAAINYGTSGKITAFAYCMP